MVNLLESGQVGIKEKDLMALLAICGVTDIEERAKLLRCYREIKCLGLVAKLL